MTKQTLKQEAANLVEEIMEWRYSMDDYDGGVYVGIAGNGYSVLYASRLLPEKTEQYANFCNKMVEEQLKQIQVFFFLSQFFSGSIYFLLYLLFIFIV